jgi:hypothetical protein
MTHLICTTSPSPIPIVSEGGDRFERLATPLWGWGFPYQGGYDSSNREGREPFLWEYVEYKPRAASCRGGGG